LIHEKEGMPMKDYLQVCSTRRVYLGTPVTLLLMLIAMIMLSGCNNSEQTTQAQPPIAIEAGDECHVCGMIIVNYPGPKGEAYLRHSKTPLKFCSTRDLFSYLLQPESQSNVTQVYVHDMGAANWAHPVDSDFIEARAAWYVADMPLKGAMGPTLASFKSRQDARAFMEKHGGRLLQYQDITLTILATLSDGTHNAAHP
jgi:copper chaperone NosL